MASSVTTSKSSVTEQNKLIIESVYKRLTYIKYLNSGGCGVAAYAVYKHLSIYYPDIAKEVKLVFFYRKGDNCASANKKAMSNNKFDYVPSHIVLKYDKFYFDSNFVNRKYQLNAGIIQVVDKLNDFTIALLELINNNKSWNKSFNRKKCIPVIEYNLSIKLKEIKTITNKKWHEI